MVRPPLPLLLTCGRHPVEAGQMSQVQSQRARVAAFATTDPGGRDAINSESTRHWTRFGEVGVPARALPKISWHVCADVTCPQSW